VNAIDHRARILAAIARTRSVGLQLAKVHVRDLEALLVDLDVARTSPIDSDSGNQSRLLSTTTEGK
jgi:hypothetical protein